MAMVQVWYRHSKRIYSAKLVGHSQTVFPHPMAAERVHEQKVRSTHSQDHPGKVGQAAGPSQELRDSCVWGTGLWMSCRAPELPGNTQACCHTSRRWVTCDISLSWSGWTVSQGTGLVEVTVLSLGLCV